MKNEKIIVSIEKVQEVAQMIAECVGCGVFFNDCDINPSFEGLSFKEILDKLDDIKRNLIGWEKDNMNETSWWFYTNEDSFGWESQWTPGRFVKVIKAGDKFQIVANGGNKELKDSFLLSYIVEE